MFATGDGVAKDSVEAWKWFRKAADQGYAMAQYNFGVRYASGEGVARDPVEALAWFRLAEEGLGGVASDRIGRLERELGSAKVALAQERTKELRAGMPVP